MKHIIYSFLLFIYTGTSGLAYNEAILNRVLKEKKNRYQENQYTESSTLKTHRHATIKKIGIDWCLKCRVCRGLHHRILSTASQIY